MNGFGLILGHLVGDFIIQNDWMAANKANQHPGPPPGKPVKGEMFLATNDVSAVDHAVYWLARGKYLDGHLACTIHCLLYTLAVWLFSFWWMPWWGPVVCFLAHWPVDRFRLAGWWMTNVSGQAFFASKEHPLFPWSIVVVDNVFHLLTLFLIGLVAGQ